MLFNSHFFLFVFLPIVLCVWWSRRLSTQARLIAMVVASYCFYGWWDYRFVGLLLFSSLVDYQVGWRLDRAKRASHRRGWLLVSLMINLGLLGYFKYSGFMAESFNALAAWLRTGGSVPVQEIILPIGISFYTFQTLSYSLDIYRGVAKPTRSFWHFAAYVSLFPQLIAGPIVRYSAVEQQLRSIPRKIDWNAFSQGLFFFVIGLSQKVLLADLIATRINPLFADHASMQLASSWYAMLGYGCQLYFDFAGYSNMAVGLGWMLGFSFPQNFDSPYQSRNISEFWRRWHITLSSWLRDYLFIPLGGSRCGTWLTLRNLFLVMFLGGLWHGAGWTFVLWGIYHAILLAAHSVTHAWVRLPRIAGVGLTFVAVTFGWVLFRATNLEMAQSLYAGMLGVRGIESDMFAACGGALSITILVTLLAIVFGMTNVWQWRFRHSTINAIALATLLFLCVLRFDVESPFLYFQF